jgi:hypothetical protein
LTAHLPGRKIEHMFDSPLASHAPLAGCAAPSPCAPTAAELESALDRLAALDGAGATEAEQIEYVSSLERLKGALAAAQARVTDNLARARADSEAQQGVPSARRCQGLSAEIALARRTSPFRGARDLGLAKVLVREMPQTHHLLTRGEISEWRATLVVRETAVLSVEHRQQVDAELADKLPTMGDREAAAAARKIGYRLDPGSAIRRTRGARSDRHVSLRPAPDSMTYLTGFLPVEQGVACIAALRQAADTARAAGDQRSRGQVMADALVERITGRASTAGVDVEVQVVMTDSTLLTDDHSPAEVVGYGPLHAALARDLVREAPRAWLRRLYRSPDSGALVAMDCRRRVFDGELRAFLVVRDQVCRTPWCDAPIRHADHSVRSADGGETTAENGQGLCEACNYAKEAAGWQSLPLPSDRHEVLITTPTGHTYVSTAPDPPRPYASPPDDAGDLVQFYSEWRTPEDELRLLLA